MKGPYLGFVVIVLQFYEWFVIYNIINYQKHKTFAEILFIMNNSEEHLKFIKKEKKERIVLYIYLAIFTALTVLSWGWTKLVFKREIGHWLYILVVTNTIIFVLLLVNVLYKLINIMAKFHVEEYEIHRSRIFSFVLIEALIIAYQFNHNV